MASDSPGGGRRLARISGFTYNVSQVGVSGFIKPFSCLGSVHEMGDLLSHNRGISYILVELHLTTLLPRPPSLPLPRGIVTTWRLRSPLLVCGTLIEHSFASLGRFSRTVAVPRSLMFASDPFLPNVSSGQDKLLFSDTIHHQTLFHTLRTTDGKYTHRLCSKARLTSLLIDLSGTILHQPEPQSHCQYLEPSMAGSVQKEYAGNNVPNSAKHKQNQICLRAENDFF